MPDRELRRLIRKYVEFDDLADAPIPLHLIAFDLLEARELRLSEGPAVDAVAVGQSSGDEAGVDADPVTAGRLGGLVCERRELIR